MPRLRPLSALVLLSALAAAPARGELLREGWFASEASNHRIGHVHELTESEMVGGQRLIRTVMESQLRLSRGGTSIDVHSRAEFFETPEGDPVRLTSVSKLSAVDYTIRVERKGPIFLVTQESLGKKTETEVPYAADVLFPYALERAIRERGLKPGARVELKTFSPDVARPTRVTVECKHEEKIDIPGKGPMTLLKIETTQDAMPGVTLSEWRDSRGEVWRTHLPLLGIDIVSYRTSRDQALVDPEGVEVLISTMVDPGTPIVRPRDVTRALYEIRPKGSGPAKLDLPTDPAQRVAGRQPTGVLLEVRRESWEKTPSPAPGASFRTASSALQSDDAEVQRIARTIAPGASGQELAAAIVEWVSRNIGKKSLSVGLASAAEVARDRAGDCTEHAVLAAALGRARGLPTRVAMGLVYLNGLFGYHMWTEFWVEGWHRADAALGQAAADATHIKLAESDLSQGFVDEGMIGLVQLLTHLDVRVVEYDLDGKTRVSGARPAGAIRDGAYENELYGLKVEPPKGWRLSLPGGDARTAGKLGTTGAAPAPADLIVRLSGPGGLSGELQASSVSYDFDLQIWLEGRLPGRRMEQLRYVAVGAKPGRRAVIEGGGTSEALLAFVSRETVFTVRLRPWGPAAEKALDALSRSIELKD